MIRRFRGSADPSQAKANLVDASLFQQRTFSVVTKYEDGLLAALGIATSELNLGTDIVTAQGPTVIKAGAPVVFTAPFSRLRMPHSGNKLR
jgi:hypothetical protein